MTVTTQETYTVDGTVLNTLAYNLSTLTGRVLTADVRGENRQIPFRRGATWVPKEYGELTETWVMWVVGADVDGLVPAAGVRAQFNQNLDSLKRLFGVRHRLLSLQKQVLLPSGLVTLSAEGECVGSLDPTVQAGGSRAVFTADLNIPDGCWYGPAEQDVIDSGGAVVTNPGSMLARKMTITLDGPLSNPKLTNTTLGIDVRWEGDLAGGEQIVLDVDAFTAVRDGSENVVSEVVHNGSYYWCELVPGVNTFTLENHNGGAVGAGTATIDYEPPYL